VDNQDFKELRTLLAWKGHESPPPGFFRHLPDRVISRIEAEKVLRRTSLLSRLATFFDLKPLIACSYGLALGSLLVWGINSAQPSVDPDAQLLGAWPSAALAITAPTAAADPNLRHFPAHSTVILANNPESLEPDVQISSALPVFDSPPAFLMNQGRAAQPQTVRFTR